MLILLMLLNRCNDNQCTSPVATRELIDMQLTDLVAHEKNVGVRLVNVKTEHCKTRVNIAEFRFILFSYDVSVRVPLILPKLLIAIFN